MESKKSERSSGQISLLISVMMLTFIMLFAFVINTGMLVNAKINLQNAADFAAYAGAAVQARQLNHISFLNYEMRRQYKKFLFRNYVVGNNAQSSFPRTGSNSNAPAPWEPTAGGTSYGVPTVCVIFNSNDNFCQLTTQVGISIPPATQLDAINNELRTQLQALEGIRTQNCQTIGKVNYMLALNWLFNTDPTLDRIGAALTDPNGRKTFELIRGLSFGLGLLPREFILFNRINTLAGYINQRAQTKIDLGRANSFRDEKDFGKFERPIQAFFSAYYTLGEHTFPGGDIELDELIPNSDSNPMLKLKPHTARFDVYPIQFEVAGGATGQTAGDCRAKATPIILRNPITVGVYKEPSTLVYYAIRLKARAKLMFSPFGDLDLYAYSAAQPFGSRIGPDFQGAGGWTRTDAQINTPGGVDGALNLTREVPNLPVFKQDTTTRGRGWDQVGVLGSMFFKLGVVDSNTGQVTGSITAEALESAYQAAMVPNPFETAIYNIPNDLKPEGQEDPFVKYFDNKEQFAFWAPIFPLEKLGNAAGELGTALNSFLTSNIDNSPGSTTGSPSTQFTDLAQAIRDGLDRYVAQIQDPATKGEDGEGFRIVRLRNPFITRPINPTDSTGPITFGGTEIVANPKEVKSSWNQVRDGDMIPHGRVGYSVKFVTFESLTSRKQPATQVGGAAWSNTIDAIDEQSNKDLTTGKLKH